MAKHYFNLGKTLQKLLYDKRINASQLAREVHLPIPTVHRLLTGKSTRPYKSSLKPIADYFSIELEQLIGEKPLYSEKLVFHPHHNISSIDGSKAIPVCSWNQLSNLEDAKTSELSTINVAENINSDAFALVMIDHSMEPVFLYNSILIFSSNMQYKDRSYMLVQLAESNNFIFRQFLDDGDYKYLKPLNPDTSKFQIRLLDANDKIIATLIEARNCLK